MEPEDIELGEDVTEVFRGTPSGAVFSIRFDSEDAARICRYAEHVGREYDVLDVLRDAVLEFLKSRGF